MRLIIIANRLPLKASRENGEYSFSPSEGGLVTGLNSMDSDIEKVWIGWPGIDVKFADDKKLIDKTLLKFNYHPVYLNKKQIRDYYEGYSNSKLWPLCHYFYTLVKYEKKHWEAYKEVNGLFLEKAAEVIQPGDIVWVQDYHLMLLPAMIRGLGKEVSIGYFHHIPFPSYELFRVLPERDEILNGLMGCDLIGFHTHEYMRHFISACERVLDVDFSLDKVWSGNREVYVDTHPMGINYNMFHDAINDPEVARMVEKLRLSHIEKKMMLSVDRLDYSKGILNRLKGFSSFLKNHEEYRGKISLNMIIVPSRDSVESYADLKTKVDQTIGAINGEYSDLDWTPVKYFYHSFDFKELVAMYHVADIALVTPLRDGMNLVAKEYVASKRDNPGVLILSEMAGASIELMDAVIINPNEIQEIEDSILLALEMPEEEQKKRIERMQAVVSKQTIDKWTGDYLKQLQSIGLNNKKLHKKLLTNERQSELKNKYNKAKSRLIILDYDGTLVGFKPRPEDAFPDESLLSLLNKLTSDSKNRVVISSGRDHKTLDKWVGHLNLGLAAEHGAFYKENGKWFENLHQESWDQEILSIFNRVTDKTPRSTLETKQTALVWHYRKVDPWLASIRSQQLINELIGPCTRKNLHIVKGDKILEVKYPDCTKGSEVNRLLEQGEYDFIMAIGDDTTDEDMFKALPDGAISIKIGNISEFAKYKLLRQKDNLEFLEFLMA